MEKKQRTLNNKGFSLIELIVVIAIMAILVGALAPQYMKFVERSRKSTDVQNVAAIKSALEVYAADPMVTTNALTNGKVTITTTEEAVSGSNATGNGNAALAAAGISNLVLKSTKWPTATAGTYCTSYSLEYTVSPDGTVKFSESGINTSTHSILNGKYD
ncbi:MAG: prepilin-type N-terminal cleavage/methylation domain-containing protein [Lachnospiraceae bacterium]|nr:prepilin-type N-terminal cleavage/methylation domain-containing protein [Lachnospiraceae bacterium]